MIEIAKHWKTGQEIRIIRNARIVELIHTAVERASQRGDDLYGLDPLDYWTPSETEEVALICAEERKQYADSLPTR